eukprot:CAMPEP_0116121466 /NCGR_PEP_ID=MMETSP0329-20121206/3711_1 /TAXON_ID=697910 /ORGANISM="Pseudo-nitzschia arenysensis, Strain B593" /LENGTH=574 /DNA_ID=CAMNT_0003615279 /DNA_START=173 /DNA_END=1897 /DNA_ORIENTATION=-
MKAVRQGLSFIRPKRSKKQPATPTNIATPSNDDDDDNKFEKSRDFWEQQASKDEDDANPVQVYEDNDEEEKPAPAVVSPEPTPLTNEERKARARRAVEERKKKSRMKLAAAQGKPVPQDDSAEELRRQALKEERDRLLELERKKEQEEREMLEKEEAEMKALEEALKKEEEEARKLAEQHTVEVETVDSTELKEEEAQGDVEKAAMDDLFDALAKEQGADTAGESGADVTQFVDFDEDESADYVGDVNHRESMNLPDLDDLLGGSGMLDDAAPTSPVPPPSTRSASSILNDLIDGSPEKEPAKTVPKKKPKKKWTKPEAFKPKLPSSSTRPARKPTGTKPPGAKKPPKKPYVSPYAIKPITTKKKSTVPSSRFTTAPKRPVTKKKPPTISSLPRKPKPPVERKKPAATVAIFRTPGSPARNKPPIKPSSSVDSMGSQCTFNSMPLSPYLYGQISSDTPTCGNKYIPNLHPDISGCQVCIFKLSESEKADYEKNGRHLRVNMTRGGCSGCNIFPSAEGEEPVRICKQCFFDTHLQFVPKRESFGGSGDLFGVSKYYSNKYAPVKSRYAASGASVS